MTVTTRIFALGGGTFGEHRDTYKSWSLPMPAGQEYYEASTTPVDKLILEATGKTKPRILVILTASEDGQHDLTLQIQAFRKHFESLGAVLDTLRLVTERPSIDEIKQKISQADAVYVSGGNTHLLMRTWRRLGIDKLLRQTYDAGTVMSGMSAGSICWFNYGNSNSFYTDKPFRVTAMGWLPFLICPHYDTEPYRQEAMKKMMKRTPKIMGIALDEHAAIEIKDNTYKVHLFKQPARVQKCYWDKGKYKVESVKPHPDYLPLAELSLPFDLKARMPIK